MKILEYIHRANPCGSGFIVPAFFAKKAKKSSTSILFAAKNILVGICLLFLFSNPRLVAQDSLDLPQIVALSMKQNFDIQVSNNAQKYATTQNSIGQAGFLPKVVFSVGDRWNSSLRDNPTSFVNGKIVSNNLTPTINIDQVVFNGFVAHISKNNFDQLEALSQQNTSLVIANNLKAVYLSYYQIQTQKSLFSNQLQVLGLSQKLYDYNKQKWSVGLITTQELNTYYGFVLEDSLALLSLKTQVLKLEGDLAKICNTTSLKVTSQSLPTLKADYSLDSLIQAMSQNPNLKSAYINQKIKENEFLISKSAFYPQLLANGGYSYSRSNIELEGRKPVVGTSKDYYLGFTLNYNLFNGFKTKTNVDLAQINLETQQLKTKQIEAKLNIDLEMYFYIYQDMYQQYALSQKLVSITQNTLDYWQVKQKAGLITSIELRNYQKNYLLNKNNEVNQWFKAFQTDLEIQTLSNQLVYE